MGPREKGTAPHPIFGPYLSWPNGWMDQDAMPLGTEVNLGAGDVVLDGVAAPPLKGHSTPFFGPCLLWPNGCTYQDTTVPLGTEVGLRLGDIVLDGTQLPLP